MRILNKYVEDGLDASFFASDFVLPFKFYLESPCLSSKHGRHHTCSRGPYLRFALYVLAKNPKVRLFVPDDPFFTGTVLPPAFLTTDARPQLPAKMRYFRGGARPEPKGWVAWSDTNMTAVNDWVTIGPHMHLVSLVSEKPAFKGLREISLVLDMPAGPVIFVGCSHPGIERIIAEATTHTASKNVSMIVGGLHLLQDKPEQIDATLNVLKDSYHVRRMAIGHCSGELTFEKVQERWEKQNEYAGLGETITF